MIPRICNKNDNRFRRLGSVVLLLLLMVWVGPAIAQEAGKDCGLTLKKTCEVLSLQGTLPNNPLHVDSETEGSHEPLPDCEWIAGPLPGCFTVGKPVSLTFLYTGAGCRNAGSFGHRQDGSAECQGRTNNADPVTVDVTRNGNYMITVDGGGVYSTLAVVGIGDEFEIVADEGFQSDTVIELFDGYNLQIIQIHTSCSKPLAVGDEFGGLRLVAFNGWRETPAVVYDYEAANTGSLALKDVTIMDDNGTPDNTDDDFNPTPVLDGGGYHVGDTNRNDRLDPREIWSYNEVVHLPVTTTFQTVVSTATATVTDNEICKRSDTVVLRLTPEKLP